MNKKAIITTLFEVILGLASCNRYNNNMFNPLKQK